MAPNTTQWYVFIDGLPEGPMTVLEVAKKIRSGQVLNKDMLFKAGDKKWRPAEDFEDFKEYFEQIKKRPRNDEWVILVKDKSEGQTRFQQVGPMNSAELIENLKNGVFSRKDFVWQDGMTRWERLDRVETFKSQFVETIKSSVLELIKPKNILHEMVEKVSDRAAKKEKIPAEAEGEDLASKEVDFKDLQGDNTLFIEHDKEATSKEKTADKNKEKASKKDTFTQLTDDTNTESKSSTFTQFNDEDTDPGVSDSTFTQIDEEPASKAKKRSRHKKSKKSNFLSKINLTRWTKSLLAAGVVLVVCIMSFLIWGQLNPKTKKPLLVEKYLSDVKMPSLPRLAKETKTAKKAAPTKAAAKAKPVVAKKPKEKVEDKKSPTYLKVTISGSGGTNPSVRVVSDASSHHKVWFYFYSKAGKILNQKSFHWIKTERRKAFERSSKFLFSDYNLPKGKYQLTVKIDKLEKDLKFDVGPLNRDYIKQIRKYRKQNYLGIQREKKRLYTSAKRLVRLANGLVKILEKPNAGAGQWGKFRSKLSRDLRKSKRPEQRLSRSNKTARVYYPKAWREYSAVLDEFNGLVNTIHKSKVKNIFVRQARALRNHLTNKKNQMASISSW